MHPAVAAIADYARKKNHLTLPLLFVLLATAAQIHTPVHHSLLVAAVSWAVIWIPTAFRAGLWPTGSARSRGTSWLAGGFLALAQLCDRAACDKPGVWSTKGFLPIFVALAAENEFLSRHVALPTMALLDDSDSVSEKKPPAKSFRLLATVTVSACAALATRYNTTSTAALSLSSVIFAAAGLVLFEGALKSAKDDADTGRRGFMSANGTFSRRSSLVGAKKEQQLASLRDVAAAMTLLCGLAMYFVEPAISPDAITWEPIYRQFRGDWKTLYYHQTILQLVLTICANVIINVLTFLILTQQSAVHISFLSLFSYMFARLNLVPSFSGAWFTFICGAASLLFLSASSSAPGAEIRGSIRLRRVIVGITALSIGVFLLRYTTGGYHFSANGVPTFHVSAPEKPLHPVPMDLKKGHPAAQLIDTAEKEFDSLLKSQSKSLEAAVKEYRRRNGIAPPPHFDKWYEFAVRNNVVLIDEFDTITQSLLPFWAVKPETIRTRIRQALGHDDSALVGIMIRDGNVVKVEGGQEWQQQATTGMMKEFVQYLPDMDLGFNIHDEPRVVVPNDELSLLVSKAQEEALPAAMKVKSPRNSFSSRPSDVSDGKRFEEVKTSKFNRFAHQQTWTHARLSCPINSPARYYDEHAADNLTAYAAGPLNYVYNHTAFSDICNSPSLSSRFGFFERPNAFSITHELTPIFSQSKISSFQDILYPSPWYWDGRVGYDKNRDSDWKVKNNSIYWRGSTTGGFSRNGGWRRQHRQHVVRRLNALDKVNALINKGKDESPDFKVEEIERKDFKELVDVKFSHIGQCDPGDCDAQKEFFEIVERADGQDAWGYKHLLDMDGNAFSGRFYSFLKSNSLTYKMAMFREWHQEWLKPWVHYVPLSLIGDEHLDLVRWFGGYQNEAAIAEGKAKDGNGGSLGERKAQGIAERSTEWQATVLRNVDFEAWFFRLLLEYGRIIDDNREEIGYPGP